MRARLGSQSVIRSLDRRGLPLTRQNYINALWEDHVPEGEWTAEHEDTLPRELQLPQEPLEGPQATPQAPAQGLSLLRG